MHFREMHSIYTTRFPGSNHSNRVSKRLNKRQFITLDSLPHLKQPPKALSASHFPLLLDRAQESRFVVYVILG